MRIKGVGRGKAFMDLVALGQCGMTVGCEGEGLAEENPKTGHE